MTDRRNGARDRRVADRRQSTRSIADCQIRLLSANSPSQILQGKLIDASPNGIRMSSLHAVDVGEKLLVEAKRGGRVLCNVTVQVVWSKCDSPGNYAIGCEALNELSPRQLAQLKSFAVNESVLSIFESVM